MHQALINPFPASQERQSLQQKSDGFRPLYIPGHFVIARLTEAFGFKWDFEIITWAILPNPQYPAEAMVHGRLTAHTPDGDVHRDGIGGKRLGVHNGAFECITDDLKAATTDAVKKAATLFGVALYLYGKDDKQVEGSVTDPVPAPVVDPNAVYQATPEQVAQIRAMLAQYQVPEAHLIAALSIPVLDGYLTQGLASQLLTGVHPFVQQFITRAPAAGQDGRLVGGQA